MSRKDAIDELEVLLRSRHAMIVIDTAEEDRAEGLLRELAERLSIPFFVWTRTKGLRRGDGDGGVYGTAPIGGALDHVEKAAIAALYHFRDVGRDLENASVAAKLLDASRLLTTVRGAVVLTGVTGDTPRTVHASAATLKLPHPTQQEMLALVNRLVREFSDRGQLRVEIGAAELKQLLANLKGLTLHEAERALSQVMMEDRTLSAADIAGVARAKRDIIEREGLLHYHSHEEGLGEVGNLEGLKDWLAKRRGILHEPDRAASYGLPFPKGVLLVGVPGSGKSLCARAVATDWKLPLLKLDPGNLYNKYVGESERNFRRALDTAARLSPVVLWIDELEKAFAAGGTEDAGVSLRVLGSFLGWLQDRKGDVFVVATANDVNRLPPELLRKGRFDEMFFVDLPTADVRALIFGIHLRRRNQPVERFDLDALAAASADFSGAEIEQAVVAALYTAFAASARLTQAMLMDEIARTKPLAAVFPERIAALRAWARERTVPAA